MAERDKVGNVFSPYHPRFPYEPGDNTVIFAPYFAAEKPSPENLKLLDVPTQHLLHQRHRAKRATDLEECSILDHTPLDMSRYAPQAVVDARIAAAREVVGSWMGDDFVRHFAEHLHEQLYGFSDRRVTFTQIVSMGMDRYNFLAPVYEDTLIESLEQVFNNSYPDDQVSFDRFTIPIVSVPKRTESRPVQRLARQPYLDLKAIKEGLTGKRLVLLDDHVQSGGTFATFLSATKQLGDKTKVLGITALSTHPTAQDLRCYQGITEVLVSYVDKQSLPAKSGRQEVDDLLSMMGMSITTLTSREALYLIGMLMDGRNNGEREAFFDLIRRVSRGVTVPEGEEDNFKQFSNSPPMTLREISFRVKELIDERARELKIRMCEGYD